jgi:hypothetical protein
MSGIKDDIGHQLGILWEISQIKTARREETTIFDLRFWILDYA